VSIKSVILDLDGTVYRGDAEVPGAADFVGELRRRGLSWLFVTNRANRTPEEVCAQLNGYGIPCSPSNVLTSAEATARHLRAGSVFMIGEAGLRRALEEAGFTFSAIRPDWVVVSLDREFTYAKLATASRLIRAGARFVATNEDAGLKTDEGILPGTGALVAAVRAASDAEPVVVGKPSPLIIRMALDRLGLGPDDVLAVGDNVMTDIPAAAGAGARSALLLTGISDRESVGHAPVQPTWTVSDYRELSDLVRRLA
jgi:4-nitrophenyl phosphatase